jgi:hypothetical protein
VGMVYRWIRREERLMMKRTMTVGASDPVERAPADGERPAGPDQR